ncbi:MAG: SEL1-like repeat protein, partial [Pseudomonadales bacterium]|nr:SEL1-like repeat protein [Pseudomonadales bacterium]
EQNYSVAQYWLGVMHQNGTGVAKDESKSVEWYRKAAEQNYSIAQYLLGWMYENGKGMAKDEVKAVEWYRKAAEAGHVNAQINLGWMYAYGKGIGKDESKAVELYRKAAEAGSANAQTKLGYAYETGQGGLPKDDKKAVEWYTKSAEGGYDYGMVNLGMKYIYGEGIKKDGKKGLAWIEKAAASGSEYAVKKLTELKEKGSGDGTKITFGGVVGVAAEVGASLLLNTVGVRSLGTGIGDVVAEGVDSLLPNANVKIGQSVKKDADGAARVVLEAYKKQPQDSEQARFYKTKLEQYLEKNTVQDVALQKEIKAQFAKPPQLVWEIEPDNQISQETMELAVNLKDTGSGIGNVRLLVDGVAVDQQTRGLGRTDGTTEQRVFLFKPTEARNYKITVEAYNAENLGQPAKLETTITSTYQKPYKPRLHAVVIGIDQYKNSQLKLNYAVSDANAIYASLNKQIGGLYDAGNITLLTTPTQTSKQAIQQAINQVKQNAQLADVFVLYVAGHGISYADTGYYMLTSDALQTSQDRIKETSLAKEELQDLIAQVPTQKKLVLLDTCNSGGALSAEKLVASRGLNDQLMIDRMKRKSGATILMASESTEQAREGYKGHGLFTYTVLQAFAGQSDYDKDGYVDSDEIKKYVEDTVPEIAEKHFKSAQTPFASSSGQGLSFKVN